MREWRLGLSHGRISRHRLQILGAALLFSTGGAAIKATTLVDSCVLLDVITGDEHWADWSARQITIAMDTGRVVINPRNFLDAIAALIGSCS